MVGLVVPEGGTPPLTTSTAQTESSNIQAQFAAQVAACVGEKGNQGNEKRSENGDKDKAETNLKLKQAKNEISTIQAQFAAQVAARARKQLRVMRRNQKTVTKTVCSAHLLCA